MATEDEITYDRSQLGVEHHIGAFSITREMILDFATSTGETNPIYCDEEQAKASAYGGLIAPPTLCNIFVDGLRRPDIKLTFGDVGLFASQAIDNVSPIRPGDTLEARTYLKEVYEKTGRSGKMVFVVWETRFTNQHGDTAVRVRDSFVRRNKPRK
jgi:acyl dehydratase